METYNKKNLTAKISKMDKELHHLDTLVPNGTLKECLKEEMTSKKEVFEQKVDTICKETKNFQSTQNSGWKGK